MKFISNIKINAHVSNEYTYRSFIINKRYFPEYNSKKAFSNKELCMKDELSTISKEDEEAVIKYLLEVMRKNDIITEEEYHTVLYKFS